MEKLTDWRKELLVNCPQLNDESHLNINAFFCRMHHLLALSASVDNTIKHVENKWEEETGKIGMASKPEFSSWNTKKESAMQKSHQNYM